MLKRAINILLDKAISRSRVILLNGARQVGKTTLSLDLVKDKNYTYYTFDDEITYLTAMSDITSFVENLKKPAIIDEVQRVPELFLAIKKDVDMNPIPGRYILTGSANPLLIPRLGDSLAGRMEVVDLMPFSQGEIDGKQEYFIDAFLKKWKLHSISRVLPKKDLYLRILRGGYPAAQGIDDDAHEAWMRNYLNLLLSRDIKDLAQIEKLAELPNLLRILAARVSSLVNVADVSRDCKLVAKTLHRYMVLLETIFLINMQQPWSTNIAQRFVKAPKMYMVDSGLLAYLLDINLEKALTNSTLMGKIVENFVVGELRKQATWNKTIIQMYHCRTTGGEEVDIILEDRSGNIVAIEVKASESVGLDDFKGIKFLQDKMKDKFVMGIVLYAGTQQIGLADNIYALPINVLWDGLWVAEDK